MTDRQIHPFDKSGVEPSRKTQSLQGVCEICLGPEPHHVRERTSFRRRELFFT